MSRHKYKPTIGIETHIQLNTNTKLFSAVGNDARQAPPNTLISHIDAGMPGALPVLNQKAVELSAIAALALHTEPQKFSRFERKHYFYPDLPKGYQITQLENSIIMGGYVDIPSGDITKRVSIARANLEEDAGKNIHPPGADYSLVDLNRAGTPLLEIVSRPEINSAAEAKAYAREMWLTMKYAGVTDGDLYLGHVRFDVNVSVSADADKLGTRSEIKNLNSFRSVENAVTYEINRQIDLLERGGIVDQETRGWDEAKQASTSQRGKEEAQDYRYMPEPDIPPIELEDDYINKAKSQLPKLPVEIRTELSTYKLEPKIIEDVLDNPAIYDKLSKAVVSEASPEIIRRVVFDSLEEPQSLQIGIQDHIKVAQLLITKKISSNSAKEILLAKIKGPAKSIEELAADKQQVSD
ncbi:MAG TPA: Asp-tRNA(Asn)/Glu-tRNA(Gln) amidotransferase subunit GatB, partial [Candidatus Saccharimonadales bacterium]|nr:Asp-tRNA(Asn)/Glu-tRNA(Gln) amidotransferase subunit GatB [Candidatus Saccharimonadales bacterium]